MKSYFNGVCKDIPEAWAEEFLSCAHTAVITVGFSKLHLRFPSSPYLPNDASILSGANRFLALAREKNVPVIHTMMGNDPGYNAQYPAVFSYVWPVTLGEMPAVEITPDIFDISLETAPADYVLNRQRRLSLFYGTDLEILLRNLGIRRVILLGSMTDCCILEAAFEAADRDFRPVVLRDLCSGTEALQEAAARIMSLHCALVVDSKELTAHWQQQE